MKLKITTEIEFNPVNLIIHAGVRYWEDAEVNGVADDEGALIPCREGEIWKPIIELSTGQVLNWPTGTAANVHYKVCDAGKYYLTDATGARAMWKGDYVPDSLLCIGERGCGDYIVMKIGADGIIEGWKAPKLDGDEWALESTPKAPANAQKPT